LTEQELIARAQAGDAAAFEALVVEHQRYVYNLALRVVANPQEAEDLAQDAFVRAWLALPNFKGQSQLRTWLYRIVTNLCFNRLPSLRRELLAIGEDVLAEYPADEFDPAHAFESDETRSLLHRQIDRLDPSYRMLIVLRYQQDLSYDEIAGVLNVPVGTVRTGLFRAKERLRSALAAQDLEVTWNPA